jgi:HK97 gp10 family phage protein
MLSAGAPLVRDAVAMVAPIAERTYIRHSKKYGDVVVAPGTLKRAVGVRMTTWKATGDPLMLVRVRQGPEERYDAFYGRFVERGTSRMAARPFMRKGLKRGAGKAIVAAAMAGRKEIDRLIGGAAPSLLPAGYSMGPAA